MRKRTLLLAATLTTGLLSALPATSASAAPSGLAGDINGDGYRDAVITAPLAKIAGKSNAGYVAVVYGSASGLNTSTRQIISQDTAGIPGVPESGDYFGDRVTTGDLDGDGYTDIVVGVHAEQIGSTGDSGVLTVLWGGASGIKSGTDISSPLPENRNELGWSVATGDFDGDGDTDLAAANIAYPELNVFKGPISRTGQATELVGIDTYEQTGINTDQIVAGDVTGDGTSDLLVMGQEEITDGYRTRSVLYKGSAAGLTPGSKVAGGYAAVIADVNKDGFGDIVTGNFMEKSTDEPNGGLGGAVTVTYGAAGGLSTRTPVRITQDTAGVPGASEKNDAFGWSLDAGDTNGDGYTDIAVGVANEDLGAKKDAGSVVILRGAASGLTGTGSQAFSQDTSGVPGTAESYDYFGHSVLLTDAGNDGRAELVTGARGENDGAGSAWTLRGSASGITTTGAKSFGSTTVGGPSGLTYFGDVLAG
ncbi:FG-GAP repeat-containing protein [Streptomyces sp. cf386]|uniref:FG-GAP and VCBS repeat-containing protein n=1 Tax=Streptomyces sp. cf386 TaxID=1761904 RepID=UPI000887ED99|nr:FG-GAP and VCBS repeat-containing protein [Streptomyces sp. cf386]SDO57529.1 FG-GAP repeat-containing protein [Streptomyces sp. cf386]